MFRCAAPPPKTSSLCYKYDGALPLVIATGHPILFKRNLHNCQGGKCAISKGQRPVIFVAIACPPVHKVQRTGDIMQCADRVWNFSLSRYYSPSDVKPETPG